MNFIAKRRAALWVGKLERWAKQEVEQHQQAGPKGKSKLDHHGMYCLGVLDAIAIARGDRSPRAAMPKDRDQRQGLADANNLIRKVLTTGRIPGKNFIELLSDTDPVKK